MILCARILTVKAGEPYLVAARDDTGTPVNWIHPSLVERCGLHREPCAPATFKDFQGGLFECRERIQVRWFGKNKKTREDEFFLAPLGSDVELVLGREFVKQHGLAEAVCEQTSVADARVFVAIRKDVSNFSILRVQP